MKIRCLWALRMPWVSGAGGRVPRWRNTLFFTIKMSWLTHDTDLCTKGIGTIWLNYVKASSINILLFELIILRKQFRSLSFQRILLLRHNGQSTVHSKSYLAIERMAVQNLQTHGGQTKERGETEHPKQMAKNKRDGYLCIYAMVPYALLTIYRITRWIRVTKCHKIP